MKILRILLPLLMSVYILGCSKPSLKIPSWDECTLASCWNGANASQRMMNMLSPSMSETKFDGYMNWMKSRGCNTSHLFVGNKGDGENSGYCIYGNDWDWTLDESYISLMKSRIAKLRANGFGIVIWLFADDSAVWNKKAKANFSKYAQDLKNAGLFDSASIVVAGLELGEYYNANEVASLIGAIRGSYSGKIGTHENSGKYGFSSMADICFYQVDPGKSATWIQAEATRVKNLTKKPVNFFELERGPNKAKCEAAMKGGAYAVGNW